MAIACTVAIGPQASSAPGSSDDSIVVGARPGRVVEGVTGHSERCSKPAHTYVALCA